MRCEYQHAGSRESVTAVDLGQLAQAGATAIVGLMATDLWTQVQARVAKLFSAGDLAREREATSDLEELRRTWTTADETQQAEVVAELRGRLKERLRSDPQLAEQFDALVAEIRDHVDRRPPVTVLHQHAVANRGSRVVQAGGDVIGDPLW